MIMTDVIVEFRISSARRAIGDFETAIRVRELDVRRIPWDFPAEHDLPCRPFS